jgi:hypothetical protein
MEKLIALFKDFEISQEPVYLFNSEDDILSDIWEVFDVENLNIMEIIDKEEESVCLETSDVNENIIICSLDDIEKYTDVIIRAGFKGQIFFRFLDTNRSN